MRRLLSPKFVALSLGRMPTSSSPPPLLCRRWISSSGPGSDDHSNNNNSGGGGAKGVAVSPGGGHQTQNPSLRRVLNPSGIELPEESFLKCIDKEITDEKLRLDKEEEPPMFTSGAPGDAGGGGWNFYHESGTSIFFAERTWVPPAGREGEAEAKTEEGEGADAYDYVRRERHLIRCQLTTRDASLDPECDVRGEHFPFSFFVQRLEKASEGDSNSNSNSSGSGSGDAAEASALLASTPDNEALARFLRSSVEFVCDVIEGELIVNHIIYHDPAGLDEQQRLGAEELSERLHSYSIGNPAVLRANHEASDNSGSSHSGRRNGYGGYAGPPLAEESEEVLDAVQAYLAARGVDDQLAESVAQYSVWVEQQEYEGWLQRLRDFVAA